MTAADSPARKSSARPTAASFIMTEVERERESAFVGPSARGRGLKHLPDLQPDSSWQRKKELKNAAMSRPRPAPTAEERWAELGGCSPLCPPPVPAATEGKILLTST